MLWVSLLGRGWSQFNEYQGDKSVLGEIGCSPREYAGVRKPIFYFAWSLVGLKEFPNG